MDLTDIFNELLESKTITLRVDSEQEKESIRVGLHAKLRRHKERMEKYGFGSDELERQALKCSHEKGSHVVSFSIGTKRLVRQFTILEITDATIPTNLEQDQVAKQ